MLASLKEDPSFEASLNLTTSIVTLLLNIPRESIILKYISCFNYSSHTLVHLRTSFNFLFTIIFIILCFINLFRESSSKGARAVKIVNFAASVCLSITIITLNVFILINLKPVLKNPISPYTIDIGFFDPAEMRQIKSNDYVKDDTYNVRAITKLSNVLYSNNKRLAYRDCTTHCDSKNHCSTSCVHYYWRYDNIYIECTGEARKFYKDCEDARGLRIGLKYLDSGPYPMFSCAIEKNNTCQAGCPSLRTNYNLYLVQQNEGNIEVGWNGFCNCIKRYPRLTINEDLNANLCLSDASGLGYSTFLAIFSILVFLYMTL